MAEVPVDEGISVGGRRYSSLMCSTGSGLEEAVSALAAVSSSTLPVADLQELIARTSSLSARLDGIGARALGELQGRGGGSVPDSVDGRVCPTPAWLRSV